MTCAPQLTALSLNELVQLDQELEAALRENVQRWFRAASPEAARDVFEDRKILHHRRAVLEEELRRRWEWPDDD